MRGWAHQPPCMITIASTTTQWTMNLLSPRFDQWPYGCGWRLSYPSFGTFYVLFIVFHSKGKKHTSRLSEPPRCKRYLIPMLLGKLFKWTVCVSYWMANALTPQAHPRRWNWKIMIRLIASWHNRVVEDNEGLQLITVIRGLVVVVVVTRIVGSGLEPHTHVHDGDRVTLAPK